VWFLLFYRETGERERREANSIKKRKGVQIPLAFGTAACPVSVCENFSPQDRGCREVCLSSFQPPSFSKVARDAMLSDVGRVPEFVPKPC
jgi:hypothetical protein